MSDEPTIIDKLLDNAYRDTQLLRNNDAKGDDFARPRTVDFLLRAPDAERAELVASFVNDNAYGRASTRVDGGQHQVVVLIDMPTTQNVINSVSGLITCLADLYECEYDGWGCVLQIP